MTLRFISTEIWNDPWFEELAPDAKLVFVYLFSNPHVNQIGVAKLTMKRIANDTDVPRERVSVIVPEMEASGKVVIDGDSIACLAFIPYQARSGNFILGAKKAVSELPEGRIKSALSAQICKMEASREQDICNPHATPTQPPRKDNATPTQDGCNPSTGQDSTRTVQEQKKKTSPSAHERDDYSQDFLAFWDVYPKHEGKHAAHKAWKARIKEGADVQEMTKAAKTYAENCSLKGTAPVYIKHPSTFLNPDWREWLDKKPEDLKPAEARNFRTGKTKAEEEEVFRQYELYYRTGGKEGSIES